MINLNNLKAEKEKVVNGCGNDYQIDFDRYDACEEGTLCPTCQAKLEALNLGIQAVENTIKDDKIEIDQISSELKGIHELFTQTLIEKENQIKDEDKIYDKFNDAINLLPSEDNHNFNRNGITGFLKNAILIIKKDRLSQLQKEMTK